MKHRKSITTLVILIALLAAAAAITGIATHDGPGTLDITSVRGKTVTVYGRGIYRHMSADVAIQGIAQDYVTLFVCIPLLLLALFLARKNSISARVALAGILFYFLVTYLFYLAMGMYNALFLVYAALLCLSFFAFFMTLISCVSLVREPLFTDEKVYRNGGLFLVINSVMVAFLWLGVVVPPLMDGSIYPESLQHYTTLIVQGFDLGLLLPLGIVCGWMGFRRIRVGYLYTGVYLVFLTLMMAALTAKIAFMYRAGANVIPVVFIMPTVCLIALGFSLAFLKKISASAADIGAG